MGGKKHFKVHFLIASQLNIMQNNIYPITFLTMIEGIQRSQPSKTKKKRFLTIGLNGQVHHSKEMNFLSSKMNVLPGY